MTLLRTLTDALTVAFCLALVVFGGATVLTDLELEE